VTRPPDALVRSLIDGPSPVVAVTWHESCTSTNLLAAAAADAGAPEITVVGADHQTAGRGRRGRAWAAPPGTSLLVSLVLRPPDAAGATGLLPLLAGLALAETVGRHLPGSAVAVKWPNDLLVDGAKAAGTLAELRPGGAVVLGSGVDVDWRGVDRRGLEGAAGLAGTTSLAEAAGADVDRWRVLAGYLGVLGRRYAEWRESPTAFLGAYRARCATLGRRVRVELAAGALEGSAEAVGDDGLLEVRDDAGVLHRIGAGDVVHLRGADGA